MQGVNVDLDTLCNTNLRAGRQGQAHQVGTWQEQVAGTPVKNLKKSAGRQAEHKTCAAGDHAVSHRRRIAAKVLNEHSPDARTT